MYVLKFLLAFRVSLSSNIGFCFNFFLNDVMEINQSTGKAMASALFIT